LDQSGEICGIFGSKSKKCLDAPSRQIAPGVRVQA